MEILEEISQKVKELSFLAKGKRGLVYTGIYNSRKVAVKMQRPESKAIMRVANEGNILKRVNKKKIGPKLIFCNERYLVYEFVKGDFIIPFLEASDAKKIKGVLADVFSQLFVLDRMKLDKEEMHHPVKHILITVIGKKPVLIDFERAHFTEKPKNVTQFVQFIVSQRISQLLMKKGIKISRNLFLGMAKGYKEKYAKKDFDSILAAIKQA
jgi:putative serine/threonine protein kinase